MFCFDTSYKGGKYFLPILKLLGLTCAIFFFPVYCNLGVLFLIDVRKIICLSSNEILLYPFGLKLYQNNASLEYSCLQHF